MPKIKYRALSDLECNVLYQIWLIEEQRGVQQATRDRLARWLKIKPGYLGKVVNRITKISAGSYLKSHRLHGRGRGGRSGPPRVYYELIGERLVTFPETAFLLLELLNFPKELARRVNYAEFVSRLKSESAIDEGNTEVRIHWAMENDYVVTDDAGVHIACLERTAHERSYLEMLASHFGQDAKAV